jgi:hypothetical protein
MITLGTFEGFVNVKRHVPTRNTRQHGNYHKDGTSRRTTPKNELGNGCTKKPETHDEKEQSSRDGAWILFEPRVMPDSI